MQIICTSLQTDNHVSTSSLNFLQAGCPSYRPTNSVNALKATNACLVVKNALKSQSVNNFLALHTDSQKYVF